MQVAEDQPSTGQADRHSEVKRTQGSTHTTRTQSLTHILKFEENCRRKRKTQTMGTSPQLRLLLFLRCCKLPQDMLKIHCHSMI